MLGYILVTLAFGMAGGIIYFYFQKQGQFEDSEEPKYQMLREQDHQLPRVKEDEKKRRREKQTLSFGDEPIINHDK